MVLYRIYVFFSTKRFHTGSTSFSPHTCCRILSGNSYHSRTTVLRQILSDYASMIYDKWLLVDQQKNYLLKDLSNWTHKLNMRKPTITNHVKSLRWIFFCNIGAITHLYFPDYCQWQWQEMQISCTVTVCNTSQWMTIIHQGKKAETWGSDPGAGAGGWWRYNQEDLWLQPLQSVLALAYRQLAVVCSYRQNCISKFCFYPLQSVTKNLGSYSPLCKRYYYCLSDEIVPQSWIHNHMTTWRILGTQWCWWRG